MNLIVPLLALILTSPLCAQEPIYHTIRTEGSVYSHTVTRWYSALDKYSKTNSTTYIVKKVGGEDKLHRVGHRDLIIWIPSTTDLSKKFTAILWFHGHLGYIKERTFQDRILKQFSPHSAPGTSKNFVVILPEMPWSINTTTPKNRNGQLWQKPGDFLLFISQVEGILARHVSLEGPSSLARVNKGLGEGLGEISYRVVGHSAGGSTIATIGHTGDLCKILPTLVVWSDSSYGQWLPKAWNGCLGKNNVRTEIFVKKWGSPWRRSTKFIGKFQRCPKFLHLHVKGKGWSHKKIGNNIVNLSGILD